MTVRPGENAWSLYPVPLVLDTSMFYRNLLNH